MAGIILKQPNGLYCRFSSVVDCPTHYNMTREDYIEMKKQEAEYEANEVLDKYTKDFEMLRRYFSPQNMTRDELECAITEMQLPADQCSMKTT